jgi:hypothetical protein
MAKFEVFLFDSCIVAIISAEHIVQVYGVYYLASIWSQIIFQFHTISKYIH